MANPQSETTMPMATAPATVGGKQVEPTELLQRLNWGEPALTIVDTRARDAFNQEHIQGAMPVPGEQIPQAMAALELDRDIYLYSDTATDATAIAEKLRAAGFQNVAELNGGLSGWKQVGGETEGVATSA